MARTYLEIEKTNKDKLALEKLTLGALKKAVEVGDMENGSIMAGEVVGQINEILSIKDLFEKFHHEYKEVREFYENRR